MELVARRKLSGHGWQCGRMSLECRRVLTAKQLESGPRLTSECLAAILVSQLLVHNADVYRATRTSFTAQSFEAARVGHSWFMNTDLQTGFLATCHFETKTQTKKQKKSWDARV